MHDHSHDHEGSRTPRALRMAFFLNLGFTVAELAGGVLTNSVAIVADAVHDLGDSVALGLAWALESIARRRPADDVHSYGYTRYSLFASFVNAVLLSAGSAVIIYHALPRIFSPQESHTLGMIGFAVFGIAVNGWAALATAKGKSMNEKVVSWHLLEDVLGWGAVLVGSIVMHFTRWWWIDPVLALGIAAFILFNILRKLRSIGRLFLQETPEGVDLAELRERFLQLDDVAGIHHLHVWSLDGEHHVLTLHAQIVAGKNSRKVKQAIREAVEDDRFAHIAIELEQDAADCSMPSDEE